MAETYLADKPNYGDFYNSWFHKIIEENLHFEEIPPKQRSYNMYLVYLDAMLKACRSNKMYFVNHRDPIIKYMLAVASKEIISQPELWMRIGLISWRATDHVNTHDLCDNDIICKVLATIDPYHLHIFSFRLKRDNDVWISVLTSYPAYFREAHRFVLDKDKLCEDALEKNPKVYDYFDSFQKVKYKDSLVSEEWVIC